jgi:hypothetical protein
MGGFSQKPEKYPLILTKEQTNENYETACKLMLETIDPKLHKDFLDK